MPRPKGRSRVAYDDSAPLTVDVLIIGGGQNGLSAAAALKAEGVTSCVVLEQRARVGDQWRERYECLHLHHGTDAMSLPGVPWPAHVHHYASRLDVADYLEAYAMLHDIDVRFLHRVVRVSRSASASDEMRWSVEVDAGAPSGSAAALRLTFAAAHLVFAAGSVGVHPHIPQLDVKSGESVGGAWLGEVLHSCSYVSADGMQGERVLVVGAGNSGFELCCDLYEHGAKPSLLVRGPNSYATREAFALYHSMMVWCGPIMTHVPLVWIFAPLVLVCLDVWLWLQVRLRYGELASKGIVQHAKLPMWRHFTEGRLPTYVDGICGGDGGVSLLDLIRRGEVKTYTSEIDHLISGSRTIVFADGERADFDHLLLCTGFRSIFAHYHGFVDEDVWQGMLGGLRVRSEVPALPGLWVCLGGFVATRNGQVVLAKRIASELGVGPGPGVVVGGLAMYALAGLERGDELPIRPWTVAINAFAIFMLSKWRRSRL